MANQVLLWMRQRWRLIALILVPLILLPLPIVLKSSVGNRFCFFWGELTISCLVLASKMWLHCLNSFTLLDIRSHTITNYILITIDIISHGNSIY